MYASEYIEKLKALVAEHGDAECEDEDGETMAFPEFDDDSGVYVLAAKR